MELEDIQKSAMMKVKAKANYLIKILKDSNIYIINNSHKQLTKAREQFNDSIEELLRANYASQEYQNRIHDKD